MFFLWCRNDEHPQIGVLQAFAVPTLRKSQDLEGCDVTGDDIIRCYCTISVPAACMGKRPMWLLVIHQMHCKAISISD
jgi:hypothetical protein